MRFDSFSFGSIRIDGVTYDHDVVIDRGEVRKRKKGPSKQFRDAHGLPVMEEVKLEAKRRDVELIIAPTIQAIVHLKRQSEDTTAILHVTC